MNVLFDSDKKQLVEKQELDPLKEKYGVHIPAGQWHTLEVLESGTIIFEVKDGPYVPFVPENMMVI